MGVMLVGKGGAAADEDGGDGPSSFGSMQSVGVQIQPSMQRPAGR
jgi:hypothetical protein